MTHEGEFGQWRAMPDGQRFPQWRVGQGRPRAPPRRHPQGTFSEHHKSTVMALVALPDTTRSLRGDLKGSHRSGGEVQHQAVQRQHRCNPAPLQAPHGTGEQLGLLPDGLRFVSGSDDETRLIVYHGLAR